MRRKVLGFMFEEKKGSNNWMLLETDSMVAWIALKDYNSMEMVWHLKFKPFFSLTIWLIVNIKQKTEYFWIILEIFYYSMYYL